MRADCDQVIRSNELGGLLEAFRDDLLQAQSHIFQPTQSKATRRVLAHTTFFGRLVQCVFDLATSTTPNCIATGDGRQDHPRPRSRIRKESDHQ